MNDHDNDMSDGAVLRRYKIATGISIVEHNRAVFAALMDVPRLIEERKQLLKKLEDAEFKKRLEDKCD